MRVDPKQPWKPALSCSSRSYNVLLMLFFEWGVALHDLDFEAIRKGTKRHAASCATSYKAIGRQGGRQFVKDYVVFPGAQRPQGLQARR